MRRRLALALLPLQAVALVVVSLGTIARASATTPTFSHVMVVILENHGYTDLLGNANAPFINNELIPSSASATQMYAQTHNSPASYFLLSSGRTYANGDAGTWAGSCTPTLACSTVDSSIYQQLTDAGQSWKVYSEDQQTNCQVTNVNKYWVQHNAPTFYQQLGPNAYVGTGNGTCQAQDVPYSQLSQDLGGGTLPSLSVVIPNNCDNMHDNCWPSFNQVSQSDTWLHDQLIGSAVVPGGLTSWAQANDTLVVITMDESNATDAAYCCPTKTGGGGGHIPMWVIGPSSKVKAGGYQSTVPYNHLSVFKTMEENWSLPLLGHAADADVQDLADFFLPTQASLAVSPNQATQGTTVTLSGSGYGLLETVNLEWNCSTSTCLTPVSLGTVNADLFGSFSTTLTVPAHVPTAWYAIAGVGPTSNRFARAWFHVKPTLAVSPNKGSTQSTAAVSGNGFGAGEAITLSWNCQVAGCTLGSFLTSARADLNGDLASTYVTIPDDFPFGWYAIGAQGATTAAFTRAWFQVRPRLVAAPNSGPEGVGVTLTGSGFGVNDTVALAWNCPNAGCSGTSLGTVAADANGDVAGATISIPLDGLPVGWYAIGGTGAAAGAFGRGWYDVTSVAAALPSKLSTTPAPTPTPSPTPSPSPSPSPSPTPSPTPSPSPTASASLPVFSHVFVIVMENSEYSSIIGNTAAPYINGLATQYGVGSQYYAIMHPSLPNYLTLTGGSNFGITTDCNTCTIDATNLADQVEASGRTWRAYMESMPSPCYLSDSGTYALHHDPWVYYSDIRANTTRCAADVVPYTQLATDLSGNAVPNLVWITPNTCNDMHNCSITTGDTWLSQNVPTIVNSPAFQMGGVLFIVWDEGTTSNGCCASAAGGKVAVLVVSAQSIPGYRSTTPETHYSLLGTIEDSWSLSRLNNAACSCAPAMREYFH